MDRRPHIAAALNALAFVLIVGTLPISLPVMVVVDLVQKTRMARTRTLLFIATLLNYELIGVVLAGVVWLRLKRGGTRERYLRENHELEKWWGRRLFWWAMRIFSMTVELQNAEVLRGGPYVVMPRHVSLGDTVLWPTFAGSVAGVHVHYVVKDEILWDPTLGIVGQRGKHVFVKRDGTNTAAQIARVAALGERLRGHEAVVIYPEGTRFTEAKRARILDKLRAGGDPERLARAESLEHLLPPRNGGPLAMLGAATGADVVFAAHVGFEGAATLRHLWSGKVIGRRIRVGFWRVPAAEVPREPEAASAWLLEHWQRMDRWVGEQLDARQDG